MSSHTGTMGVFLLLACAVPAQDSPSPDWRVRVLVLEADSEVTLLPQNRPDGLVRQFSWTPPGVDAGSSRVVTLVRPVQSCSAAVTADGTGLIVLAGGPRESLDVYLVDRAQPVGVLETSGGRRLPSSFNDGLGSWPLVEGPHVVLLAFEKERRLEFRALDFEGRIHASRTLPLDVRGSFTATADPASSELRVHFQPGGEDLVFHHPLAPRLILGHGVLEFGKPPVGGEVFREAELRNGGERDLVLQVSIEGNAFRVDGRREVVVPPGEVAMVRVGFRPEQAGSFGGRLVFRANSANPDAVITLRGEGLDVRRESGNPPVAEPDRALQATDEQVPEASPIPAIPDVGALQIEPLSQDQVRVSGFLRSRPAGGASEVELGAGARSTRAPVGPEGGFAVTVGALPGERLWLSAVGGRGERSPSVELGEVLPVLRVVQNDLEIRTRPGRRFLLAVVALDEDGERIQRLLAAWKGQADPEGIARVGLDRIGPRRVAVHVLAFVEDVEGARRSNLLRLEPER